MVASLDYSFRVSGSRQIRTAVSRGTPPLASLGPAEERTFRPVAGRKDEELTASEVLSATSELLRALRLGPMELALWYRRRPDEEVYSESQADREQARKP